MPRARKTPLEVYLALSPASVAAAIDVHPDRVREAINAGSLPVHRIGTKSRVLCRDVEAWVRSFPAPTKRKRKVPSDA
jgi:excisionase family DNA binding protein